MINPTGRLTSKPVSTDDMTASRIKVPDAKLASIRERVHAFRWEAWSEPSDTDGWVYGPPVSFMRRLCEHWVQRFDWREQERSMNARPHFTTVIDDVDLHFIHERGSGENPAPLLIAHGWPYSFHSYSELVDRLAHPERHGGRAEDAFSGHCQPKCTGAVSAVARLDHGGSSYRFLR